jgi:Family of unknown function (DUF5678)
MSSIETFPAPVLPPPPEDKFRREQEAFYRLLPELLRTQAGQFVAIHEGEVVQSGDDQIEVVERAYARFGYIPILVTLVTDRPRPVIEVCSPRLLRNKDLHDPIHVQPPG